MRKKHKKNIIPDLTEFTDDQGKKWIQTSTDDLFSMKELNEVLESIDKDKGENEVVLARIDFQKVNKEYYEAAVELQAKIERLTELLKRIAAESKKTIEKKNAKLKELIDYIKKLHMYIAYITSGTDSTEEIKIPARIFTVPQEEHEPEEESVYETVEEIVLPND